MKTVLVYGDSIAWGSDPARGGLRHPFADRWPNVLQAGLGEGVTVVTDALRGRSTGYDVNLADCDRNGARVLPTTLYAQAPVDLVILALGTNDLQVLVTGAAIGALQGMRRLIEIVQKHSPRLPGVPAPKVLVVAPPKLVPTPDPFFSAMFAGALAESEKIAGYYEALCVEMGAAFFDSGSVARTSPLDGVHLDAANTRAIGTALVPVTRALLT